MNDSWVMHLALVLGVAGLGCGAGNSGGIDDRFLQNDAGGNPPQCEPVSTTPKAGPSNGNYVMVDFTNPAHRATLTEDGLEHIATEGPWAIYRVTSATPRIHIPGAIVPDQSQFELHRAALCISQGYFADVEPQQVPTEHTKIKFMGVVGDGPEPQPLVVNSSSEYAFAEWPCRGGTDMRSYIRDNEPVTHMFVELDPAPPVGSLVPLMMVAIGSYDSGIELPHMNEDVLICCPTANGCEPEYPPVVEPPDGGGSPDGGTEPPGSGEPPDGGVNEPPGTSLPPCPPTPQEPPGVSQPVE